jgi:AAA domain
MSLIDKIRTYTAEEFERETLAMILPPYVPKFGPITWRDTFTESEGYSYLVKGIIPDGEAALVYGAPQVGKSFETEHLANCVARGVPFHGFKTRRAGVVYCAFEGGKGFKRRQRAYALAHGLTAESDLPIVVLTRRADLFSNDIDFNALVIEIEHYASIMPIELGLIVLDTWSASTPGADENAAKDVSKVRQRIMKIVERFRAAVIVVHHKPKGGSTPRGHGSMTGDFETTIDVDWEGEDRDARGRGTLRDGYEPRGRVIRRALVTKQREGLDEVEWTFVLRQVEIGTDADGDRLTSCVVEDPIDAAPGAAPQPERNSQGTATPLRARSRIALQCLRDALGEHGEPALAAMNLPRGSIVVHYDFWKRRLLSRIFDPGEDQNASTVRSTIKRIGDELLSRGIIGKENPYIWIVREPSN